MTGKGVTHAKIDWNSGPPRSADFGDIYFSGDGPAESDHVFLAGNDLPARFENAERFTIGELGFGTGLNFLIAWNAWRRAPKPQGARFDFFSVEAFPLHPDDLAKAHENWPALEELAASLRAHYPPPHPGFHRIAFDDGASLTLYFGNADDGLGAAELCADAWFLDGFAPEKNPAMWRPDLMVEVARASKAGATFATFTVAGAVRRALEAAGFSIEKRPGFGAKREMLTGRLSEHQAPTGKRLAWFETRAVPLAPGARVAVIGAGIAGASLSHALRQAGLAPTLFDAQGPAAGASGNVAGLIMPRLDADDTPAARFHAQAYLHTIALLRRLNRAASVFNPCGVAFHALSDAERARQEKLLARNALPEGWIEQDVDGLFFPQGGVVDPPAFTRALIGDAPIHKAQVTRLTQAGAQWRVETDVGAETYDAAIIANGLEALRFSQARGLPLSGSAGQIDWFADAPAPARAHAFGPYAAPAPGGGLVIGATYAPIAIGREPAFTAEATQTTLAAVARVLPDIAAGLDPQRSRPRAAVRCATPDRLAVAGPIPDWGFYGGAYDGLRVGRRANYPPGQVLNGLYILTGLGSRGLVTAPLAAAMIAADITGAPSPVGADIAQTLHPARFFVRDLKRGRIEPAG